jgi:hypothetical protein
MSGDRGIGTSIVKVFKFEDPDGVVERLARSGVPAEVLAVKFSDRLKEVKEVRGNVFLNEGINYIWRLVKGEEGLTPFGSNSCVGVGDGTATADPSQTGLLGTNKYYKTVDSGYPVVQGTQIVFQATFGGAEANFTWNEWTVANGCSDDYININRKVESLGTKASGATWVLQVVLTIS